MMVTLVQSIEGRALAHRYTDSATATGFMSGKFPPV
jgi:hypothetical protein